MPYASPIKNCIRLLGEMFFGESFEIPFFWHKIIFVALFNASVVEWVNPHAGGFLLKNSTHFLGSALPRGLFYIWIPKPK